MTALIEWPDLIEPLNLNPNALKKFALAPRPEELNTDSRTITSGQWFVPLKGAQFDGHQYIDEALARGARGFFYESSSKSTLSPRTLESGVEVYDTLKALQTYAQCYRLKFSIPLVAITGSCGKTTVKEMTALTLAPLGPNLATEANFNNEIGLPKTLLRLTEAHRSAVLEMGARHSGDIAELVKIAAPTVSTLLNAQDAHLGEFGSIEKLRETKLEILKFAPTSTQLILNRDDEILWEKARKELYGERLIGFGFHKDADVRIIESAVIGQKLDLLIGFRTGRKLRFGFPYHASYPINLAAALAIAESSGVNLDASVVELGKFVPSQGRFRAINLGSQLLIDDAYNANPMSMKAGIETVAALYSNQKIGMILGDMLELGADSLAAHKRVGELAASVNPYCMVGVGPQAKAMVDGFSNLKPGHPRVFHFDSVDKLLENKDQIFPACEIVYVKGSNGINLKKVVAELKNVTHPAK